MKFENILREIQKIDIFANQMWLKVSHHHVSKNILVIYLVLKNTQDKFWTLLLSQTVQINFQEGSHLSTVRKNDQNTFHIFGIEFTVKKSETKTIQKKSFFNCFGNKILYCFL
jgi:hypothetical protein